MTVRDYLQLAIRENQQNADSVIEKALQTAMCASFIKKFSQGLNTPMGHMG
jgi:ABC-type multidrug transport system fused ATPase/permease subunit